ASGIITRFVLFGSLGWADRLPLSFSSVRHLISRFRFRGFPFSNRNDHLYFEWFDNGFRGISNTSYDGCVEHHKKLAILVGGGPAPGINGVMGAATIRAVLEGIDVVGVRDGFEWLMQGNIEHITPLTIDTVSRIHFRGGSHIGISRANPTSDPEY